MLPFKHAIRLPILLTSRTYFYSLSGKIELISFPRFGMIRFGYFGEDTICPSSVKTLLQIDGLMRLSRDVHFGNGLTIRVIKGAVLEIEENVKLNNLTKIICYDNIKIGGETRFAWECQIMDTSFHYIKNLQNNSIAQLNLPVEIGRHNWIANRVTIMKGVKLPDYTIVGSCSLVVKPNTEVETILGGVPAKILKNGVSYCLENEENQIKKMLKGEEAY